MYRAFSELSNKGQQTEMQMIFDLFLQMARIVMRYDRPHSKTIAHSSNLLGSYIYHQLKELFASLFEFLVIRSVKDSARVLDQRKEIDQVQHICQLHN